MPPGLHQFLSELRRRRVFRVALVYAAAGWVVVEVAATTAPLLALPDWTPTLVLVLVLLGLPLALVLSWLFDVTPEGLRRTAAAPRSAAGSGPASKLDAPAPWTARGVTAVGAFVVLALVAIGFATLRDGDTPSPIDASEEVMSAVAVMPFTVRGEARLAYLREGMVDLLSTDLGRPRGLRPVDAHAVLAAVEMEGDVGMAPETGRSIAERLAAGLFVLGSVVEVDGNLRVTASLYDRSRGARPVATRMVEGGVGDVLELVRRLADSLAAALPSPAAAGDPTVRLVWSDSRLDLLGSVSPDGRLVSFTDWETGDLAMRDLTSGQDRRVTDKGSWEESDAFAEFSRFSPDGSQLAYTWFDADWRYGIRVVGVDGSGAQPLLRLDIGGWCEPLGWSPDSRRILARVFPAGESYAAILWLDADGDRVDTVLTLPPKDLGDAASSPDGQWIAYDHAAEGFGSQRHLSLIAADGRAARRVATGTDLKVLAWSGDDGIILNMGADDDRGVFLLAVTDGRAVGDPQPLRARMPWLRPMGVVDSVFYYGVAGADVQSYVADIDLDAGEVTSVPELVSHASAESSSWPVWSPDGRAVAYMANARTGAPGANRLVIRRLDDGELRELVLPLDRATIQAWAPDPAGIVLWGRGGGETSYYGVDPDNLELTVLVPGSVLVQFAGMVGGRTAFVQRFPVPRMTDVVRRDLVAGDEQTVARLESDTRLLAVSPDGSHLLVSRDAAGGRPQLRSIPVAGGEASLLHESPAGHRYGRAAWSPEGGYVLVTRTREGADESELWRVRLADGDARRILTRNGLWVARVSPDGRRIVFSAGEVHGELWALRGLHADPPDR